ncbi:MAG: hypothetical protein ACERKN_19195 [Velocimicrobium sp.]
MAELKNSKQARRYLLTINNPEAKNITHDLIREILSTRFKTFTYACMADEQGSCYHTHILVCFSSAVRFKQIKKYFPEAHIDVVKGTIKQCISYIKKSDEKYADKKETSIDGSFEEIGSRPPENKGNNHDMEELYQMIVDGLTDIEIISINQDYILHLDKLSKLRTMYLQEKYKNKRRLDLDVVYVFGETGSGKSRDTLDTYQDSNCYRVTDYLHPFDGYNCQPVIIFEEYRNSIPLKDILNILDIYPLELSCRYNNKIACYTTCIICTNWKLEMQYADEQKNDRESYNAFLRRIKRVKHYKSQNEIIDYESVKAYLNRDNSFQSIAELSQEEQLALPFVTQANITK